MEHKSLVRLMLNLYIKFILGYSYNYNNFQCVHVCLCVCMCVQVYGSVLLCPQYPVQYIARTEAFWWVQAGSSPAL